MVIETSRPIAEVARELGISETSMGNWVRDYRKNPSAAGHRRPLRFEQRLGAFELPHG